MGVDARNPVSESGTFTRVNCRAQAVRVLPGFAALAVFVVLSSCRERNVSAATISAEVPSPIIGADGTLSAALGLETLGGHFTPLIARGTAVPAEVTETFSTAAAQQRQIMVTLFRGNAEQVAENHRIGVFQVQGVSDAAAGVPLVSITFSVRSDGVHLAAREPGNPALKLLRLEAVTAPNEASPRVPDGP